jgi:hypothetical protein
MFFTEFRIAMGNNQNRKGFRRFRFEWQETDKTSIRQHLLCIGGHFAGQIQA